MGREPYWPGLEEGDPVPSGFQFETLPYSLGRAVLGISAMFVSKTGKV